VLGTLAGAVTVGGLAAGAVARQQRQTAGERHRLVTALTHDEIVPGAHPAGRPFLMTADDGVRLYCEELAPPDGRRPVLGVVYVHGFALDRRAWHFQRHGLAVAEDPPVHQVFYDQRSHGRSERTPRHSCTLEQLGRDLDAVIRALVPRGPLVLVGHSMGGMTIMALAEQRPELFGERVVGVAFMATSAGDVLARGLPGTLLSHRNPALRGAGMLARVQPNMVEAVRRGLGDIIWAITRSYAYGDRSVDPWLVDLVDTMICANGVDALVDFVQTVNSHDRVAALPALANCEVLVVAGDADRVIPFSHGERIAAELPAARLVRVEGVGHCPMLERSDEVNDALHELIRRAARRGGGGDSWRSA